MDQNHCEHCGASLRQRWDRITPGEVEFLIKFRDLVIANNKNLINVPKEMNLSNVEYSDFQKLRYHALIAKHKEDGAAKRGWWVLTHRGNQFVKGEIQIPEKVRVFRNRITGYSDYLVDIKKVMQTDPYWDTKDTITFEPADQETIDTSKAEVIKTKKKKYKKGTELCYRCQVPMKRGMETKEGDTPNSMKVRNFLVCPKCGYKDYIIL